jgi:phosphohistidine phosphatase
MKEILVMRHGKSDWSDLTARDYDRPLNAKGKKTVPLMGEVLARLQLIPDMILSSSAERARQTAVLAAASCGYRKDIVWNDTFYSGTEKDVLQCIKQLDHEVSKILIVGHNPIIQGFISSLISSGSLNMGIPTASITYIISDVDEWEDINFYNSMLKWTLSPKLVKAFCKETK